MTSVQQPPRQAPAPRVRIATALIYHAVRKPGDDGRETDPIYTVTPERFAAQLDIVRDCGHTVSTIRDLIVANDRRKPPASGGQAVVLTFDDGTACHLEQVLPLLWGRRMPGEFFVNPASIGRRGYLSWNELRGMASAGMSIQSHGYSHRYMDDLDGRTIADELVYSKGVIEDRIGHAVTVFAAPGGRMNRFIAEQAYRAGYKAVCGSQPGQWRLSGQRRIVPRIAVRTMTENQELRDWLDNRLLALTLQSGRYRVLQLARRTLGNAVYDNLRQRYLREG